MEFKKTDLKTDLVGTAFMLSTVVPVVLLLISIPQEMLNWPLVLVGGVFFFVGMFGLCLMVSATDFFGKKAEV